MKCISREHAEQLAMKWSVGTVHSLKNSPVGAVFLYKLNFYRSRSRYSYASQNMKPASTKSKTAPG